LIALLSGGGNDLWRHIEGTATAPVLYQLANRVPVLADAKMAAMEEQIETKESRIIEFGKREYLAQHIILSTTLAHLGSK